MTSPTTATSASRTASAASASARTESTAARDTGLLLLRVVIGLTMAAHGTQKLFGWFGGGGIEGTGQFFEMSGYPSGEAMAVVAGLAETLGGLGLAVGLLTPLAGAALVGTLLNVLAVKGTGSFFAPKGVEYELLLTAVAAALTLTGPGRWAADRFVPVLRTPQPRHGVLALVLAVVAAGVVLAVRT
ncbi:DoxX family protein [Streptomyces sp. WAC06614]|uniref:DoxX family protein n=1 Tax=Streptomyces sp. WAC06614 TaxID=2487416 RepID=UPI000F7A7002|nr:DoxX family protein [Streptomyces sp. WAC06614]RSS76649.1 DoxX family protein [Streptomyces sp. WAC06614]